MVSVVAVCNSCFKKKLIGEYGIYNGIECLISGYIATIYREVDIHDSA